MQSIVHPGIKPAVTCQRITADWKRTPNFLILAVIGLLLMMFNHSGWWEQSYLFSQPITIWDLWFIFLSIFGLMCLVVLYCRGHLWILVKIFLYCFSFTSSVWAIISANLPLAADGWLQILPESLASLSCIGSTSVLKGGGKALFLFWSKHSLSSALKHYEVWPPCIEDYWIVFLAQV